MKRIYILICLSLLGIELNAQQTPHYTQYMYNMNILNPAYVGVRGDLSSGMLLRKQWVNMEGAPETRLFSVQGRTFDSLGTGLSIAQDKLGLMEETSFNLDLSYTIVTSRHSRFAFGIKGGVTNFTNNLSAGLTPDNETYADLSDLYPNAGFGAFFYTRNAYLGFSVPQLLNTPKFRLDSHSYKSVLNEYQNYYLASGYVFELDDNIKFKPSTLIKYNRNLPISIDFNVNVLYKEKYELGLSYRYNDAVSSMITVGLNDVMRIGYSYDYTLTDLSNFNSGSHEIILLFDFDFKKRGRWLNDSSCYF